MSQTKTAATLPVFVARQEGTVEVTLDEAITHIKALRAEMAPLEKAEKQLIELTKAMMKAKGIEAHTTPSGDRALWSESQRSEIDKELAKELLGDSWGRVHSFKTVKSFTVK
jgi:hypothetical protein